jgi:hypothetical protein
MTPRLTGKLRWRVELSVTDAKESGNTFVSVPMNGQDGLVINQQNSPKLIAIINLSMTTILISA